MQKKIFKKCCVDECARKAISKKICDKHYRRVLKHGTLVNTRFVSEGDEIKRFFDKIEINENQCWIWKGSVVPNGGGNLYGKHSVGCNTVSAHRFSYKLHYGDIPKGLFVCHKCDVPLCVNPIHLFLGTTKDNMKDMKEKNRSFKGSGVNKGASKIKDIEIIKIIRSSSESNTYLSKKFNISRTSIFRIKNNISYKE